MRSGRLDTLSCKRFLLYREVTVSVKPRRDGAKTVVLPVSLPTLRYVSWFDLVDDTADEI